MRCDFYSRGAVAAGLNLIAQPGPLTDDSPRAQRAFVSHGQSLAMVQVAVICLAGFAGVAQHHRGVDEAASAFLANLPTSSRFRIRPLRRRNLKLTPGQWELDTFLLSSQALNRGLEQAMLSLVVAECGARQVVGCYLPTAKNAPCAQFLAQSGFLPDPAEAGRWHLEVVAGSLQVPSWIEVYTERTHSRAGSVQIGRGRVP